ncbi:TonB family protein [Bacterioplanes sanyensis]|nr:TonB family protein [Bacterioplanes sanyensis]
MEFEAAKRQRHRRFAIIALLSMSAHALLLSRCDSQLYQPTAVIHTQLQLQTAPERQQDTLSLRAKALSSAQPTAPTSPIQPAAPTTPTRAPSTMAQAAPARSATPASPAKPAAPARLIASAAKTTTPARPSTIAKATPATAPSASGLTQHQQTQQQQAQQQPTQPQRHQQSVQSQPAAEGKMTAVESSGADRNRTANLAMETPDFRQDEQQWSSDPLERSYQQRLLAHLRGHLVAPAGLHGSVRIELEIRYRQVATRVQIVDSSGSRSVDDWAVRAVLAASPFPAMPPELREPFVFRPTLTISSTVDKGP